MEDETQSQPEGMGRRGVLKAAGIAAAAASVAPLAASATPAAAATAGADAGMAPLNVNVVDYVDGRYVVEVRAGTSGRLLRLRDGVKVELTAGQAQVTEDPYTGEIYVKATKGDTIRARAVVTAKSEAARAAGFTSSTMMASESTDIGTDDGDLPPDESNVVLAGGGSCASSTGTGGGDTIAAMAMPMMSHMSEDRRAAVLKAGSGARQSQLRVRAAVMGNVIPFSPDHREIRWRHARYYGVDDVAGLLRFTYQRNRLSAVTMRRIGADSFFPANAVNELYCRMELLDLGLAALSGDPMLFPSASINWPVYSSPMFLNKPVTFYDEAAPEREVMTIVKNELRLYDYNGVTIKKLRSKVTARGELRATYKVTNQTASPFVGRWMLIGDHADSAFASTDKELTLGQAGAKNDSAIVEVAAPVRRRQLSQRVGFAVMSLSDPVVLGITPTTFRFPNV